MTLSWSAGSTRCPHVLTQGGQVGAVGGDARCPGSVGAPPLDVVTSRCLIRGVVPKGLGSRLARAVPPPCGERVRYRRRFSRFLRFGRVDTATERFDWIISGRRPLLEGTCDGLAMKSRAVAAVPKFVRVPESYWAGTDVPELAGVPLPDRWVPEPDHRTGPILFSQGSLDVAEPAVRTRGWTQGLHYRSGPPHHPALSPGRRAHGWVRGGAGRLHGLRVPKR